MTEFDSADGDDDENHLKELLQKEKDAHARTKVTGTFSSIHSKLLGENEGQDEC